MKAPFYVDESVTLHHGDCKPVLASMADGSVDLVITDPPYSARTHKHAKATRQGGARKSVHFDSITENDLRTVLTECGRVSRGWVVATLDYAHAVAMEAAPPPGLAVLRIGVWAKPNPMPQISGDRPGQGWESIAFLHRTDHRPKWNGGGRSSVWYLAADGGGLHPTQKPLRMVGDWVRLFSDPGDLVLDPFAGSGTTLRAAVDNGRRAIGVELDERYCRTIVKRMDQQVLDFGLVDA